MVAFHETTEPMVDPHARYLVVYEAVFEPRSLDQGRVEVWITNDGQVAVGFERRDRIAGRLGVRNTRQGFAAGHEPARVEPMGLKALLTLVASGGIVVSARVLPWIGLGSTSACANEEALESLAVAGYEKTGWLRQTVRVGTRKLKFAPWT